MSSVSEPVPNPLVLALAEAIRRAVRNTNLVVDHAVTEGVAVLVPCACAVDVDDERCLCQLSLALPDRWMEAARSRRAARRSVGPLPKRTCVLCWADDHDLAPTYEMAVSVVGHGPIAPVRVAAPRRRSARETQARASRAGALPPDAVGAQKKAAGVRWGRRGDAPGGGGRFGRPRRDGRDLVAPVIPTWRSVQRDRRPREASVRGAGGKS